MIELLCTDYNKKATSIHYYFGNAVLAIKSFDGVRQKGKETRKCLRHLNSPSPSFMRGIRACFLRHFIP